MGILTGYTDWADNPDVNSDWANPAFQDGSIITIHRFNKWR